jgi:hypothetical protein
MRRALVLALALVGGCYSPSYNNPTCPTGECPDGFTCVQGVCVQGDGDVDRPDIDTPETDTPEVDTPDIDTPETDAPTDARTDAPTDARTDAPTDARVDAPLDAPTDAPTDTPITTYAGSVSVVETQLLAANNSNMIIGQGVNITPTFLPSTVAPVLESNPGSPVGCKAYVFDSQGEINASGGINEGSVAVTVSNGGTPINPVFPACVFSSSPPSGIPGYFCPDAASSGAFSQQAQGHFALAQPSVYSFSINSVSFSSDDVGRMIHFSGTGNAVLDNHGFPIVSFVNANTVALAIGGTPPTVVTAGSFATVAGGGINPALTTDPGQMSDAAQVTVTLDATATGSQNHVGNFTTTISNVGDDFAISDATANLMRAIPLNGSAFTIGCATCGTALGSVLSIVTTNAPVSASDPFAFPRPTSKRVQILCAEVSATSITVPANFSALLMTSGATRIQTTFMRQALSQPTTNPNTSVNVVAGHAIVGFTTP